MGVPPTQIVPDKPSVDEMEPELRSSWMRVARVVPQVKFSGPDSGEVEPSLIQWWIEELWIRLQDWWR